MFQSQRGAHLETDEKELQKVDNVQPLTSTEGPDSLVRHVRLRFETQATAHELATGTAVASLNDPRALFAHDASITHEQMQHAIITGVTVNGVMSEVPETVMMSLKLFENDKVGQMQNSSIGISNEHGWLFSNNQCEFGEGTSSSNDGFTNMLSIFPYERSRLTSNVYNPTGVKDNRFIETYGGYNGKDLWNGIVAFPTENYYYVGKDHVVMQVISQNWDSLGINPAEEVLHENKYYKLSSALVDHVVTKLQNDVLSTIPFTDMTQLKVKFSSQKKSLWTQTPESDDTFKLCTELKVSYMFPNCEK